MHLWEEVQNLRQRSHLGIMQSTRFEDFWKLSADSTQNQWDKVLELFGHDHFSIFVWGSFYLLFSIYWTVGMCYTAINLTGRPAIALRYKNQLSDSNPVSVSQVLRVARVALQNQILVGLPSSVIGYYMMKWRGYDTGRTLPSFQRVVLEVIIFALVEEVGFYYSHRLLHHPVLFKHIHRQHHEWSSPIAIGAQYCHPVENVVSNLAPAFAGPLLLGSHLATALLWVVLMTLNTLKDHSGFDFPFLPSNEAHDLHHSKRNVNFGGLGIMDYLHGTDYSLQKKGNKDVT